MSLVCPSGTSQGWSGRYSGYESADQERPGYTGFNAAHVKGIICTTDGEVMDHADAAFPESPTVKVKIGVSRRPRGMGRLFQGAGKPAGYL